MHGPICLLLSETDLLDKAAYACWRLFLLSYACMDIGLGFTVSILVRGLIVFIFVVSCVSSFLTFSYNKMIM